MSGPQLDTRRVDDVRLEVSVRLVANEAGEAAIMRYVGLDETAGRELGTEPGLSRDDVLRVLAERFIRCGLLDAHLHDGFDDLQRDDIDLRIDIIQEAY